mgnify:FL=1
MLNINTNLTGLIVQSNLKSSTGGLNRAIERLSSGFKINHAKDNAANFAIANNISFKITSLSVAEENTAMGLELITTASESLSLIEERLSRLRMLQTYVENGTYGADSLAAINTECNSIVDEIEKIYGTTQYNNINLFQPTQITEVHNASETTVFKELGLDKSSFSIYDSKNNIIQSYDTEETDSIGDFFDVLKTHGFTASIKNGEISLNSPDGYYVDGDLISALGISTVDKSIIENSAQTSTAPSIYTISADAGEGTTFEELGLITSGSKTVTIRGENAALLNTFTMNKSSTLGDFISILSNNGITAVLQDGVLSLNSSSGAYLEASGLIAEMGIGASKDTIKTISTIHTNTIYTTTTTSNTVTETIWTTTTTSTTQTNTIWTTTTTSTTQTNTIWITTTTSTTESETIWITTTTSTTQTNIIGMTQESAAAVVYTTYVQSTEESKFISDITRVDTSTMTALSSVSEDTRLSDGTYKICTTEDLIQLAAMANDYKTGNCTFVLANDIDLSTVDNWTPIGDGYAFGGTFDGNGYTVSNLKINTTNNPTGLFGWTTGTIKNLGVENVNITGASDVGGLIGKAAGTVSNCYTTGSVIMASYTTDSGGTAVVSDAGGLVGTNFGKIIDCYSEANVTGDGNIVGGLVGYSSGDGIIRCYAAGNVSGKGYVGGLAGRAYCTVEDSYSMGTVYGDFYEGGLIGETSSTAVLTNCYWNQSTSRMQNGIGNNKASTTVTGVATEALNSLIADGTLYLKGAQTLSRLTQITNIDAAVTLKDLGITANQYLMIYASGNQILKTIHADDTLASVFNDTGVLYQIDGGILTINNTNSNFVVSMSQELSGALKLNTEEGYYLEEITSYETTTISSTQTNTIWETATTSTTQTSTIWETTTSSTTKTDTIWQTTTTSSTQTSTILETTTTSTTQTNTIFINTTIYANDTSSALHTSAVRTLDVSTSLADAGITDGKIIIHLADGNYKTIQMSSSSTFGDMISELANNGITMTLNNGITAIKAVGNVWLKTSDNKIADLLNLGQVSHVTSDIKENSGSSKLEYSETVNALNPAPEQINLQVGIYSDDNSVIVMKLGFALEGINVLRQIGSDTKTDYLSRIDEMLKICNSRQTEMGALQNRLESVLEEISIKYDNLVSSYSTIKDADVAEESSEYIRNQILQQAATTLMATANQTPAIALQLL